MPYAHASFAFKKQKKKQKQQQQKQLKKICPNIHQIILRSNQTRSQGKKRKRRRILS